MNIPVSLQSQRGQAVTEFAAMAAVLVPLFLLVPLLGKVSDLNHTTIEASRYAAWERTVADTGQKPDTVLATEIRRRLYSRPDMPIHTNAGAPDVKRDRNPLWRGYGKKRVLQSQIDDVGLGMAEGKAPGPLSSAVASVVTRAGQLMGKFNSGASFDLENDGLYTARVGANVGANDLAFMGNKDCSGKDSSEVFACITRQNVILADTWDAGGPQQVASRTRAFVPMGIFSGVTKVTGIVGKIPFLKEWGRFDPGYVAPDVVPADRLGRYKG